MNAVLIIGAIIALAATICSFIYIVPEKRRNTGKAVQILHDLVNFKFLIIEKVLQATYIFSTAACIAVGFCSLFWVEEYSYGYYYTRTEHKWMGGYGLLLMIVGPIVLRLAYEMILMLILAVKNIIEINKKLKNQNGDAVESTAASVFNRAPAAPAYPVYTQTPAPAVSEVPTFCTECGSRCNADGTCPNCGK